MSVKLNEAQTRIIPPFWLRGDVQPEASKSNDLPAPRKTNLPRGPATADWLYFIECGEGGPVKIGIAGCVPSRLACLQSSNPHPLACLVAVERKVAKYLEADLHRRFADHRIHGEWFKRAPEIDALIESFRSGVRGVFVGHECTGRALVDGRWRRFLDGRTKR